MRRSAGPVFVKLQHLAMATVCHLGRIGRLSRDPLYLRRLQVLAALPRAMSTATSVGGGAEQQSGSGHRGICTNSEGTGPPRVLITGGLGQLGSGLAKELR